MVKRDNLITPVCCARADVEQVGQLLSGEWALVQGKLAGGPATHNGTAAHWRPWVNGITTVLSKL